MRHFPKIGRVLVSISLRIVARRQRHWPIFQGDAEAAMKAIVKLMMTLK
jgi:hypothetical protein